MGGYSVVVWFAERLVVVEGKNLVSLSQILQNLIWIMRKFGYGIGGKKQSMHGNEKLGWYSSMCIFCMF